MKIVYIGLTFLLIVFAITFPLYIAPMIKENNRPVNIQMKPLVNDYNNNIPIVPIALTKEPIKTVSTTPTTTPATTPPIITATTPTTTPTTTPITAPQTTVLDTIPIKNEPVAQEPVTVQAKSVPEEVNFAKLCQDSRGKATSHFNVNNRQYGLTAMNDVDPDISYNQDSKTCQYEVDYFTTVNNPSYNPDVPGSRTQIKMKRGTKKITLPIDMVKTF